jgi:hypothetical protein
VSADNYGIVHEVEDKDEGLMYGLSMFFASDDTDPPRYDHPYFTGSLREVVKFADEEYFEYGWSYDDKLQDHLIDLAEQNG